MTSVTSLPNAGCSRGPRRHRGWHLGEVESLDDRDREIEPAPVVAHWDTPFSIAHRVGRGSPETAAVVNLDAPDRSPHREAQRGLTARATEHVEIAEGEDVAAFEVEHDVGVVERVHPEVRIRVGGVGELLVEETAERRAEVGNDELAAGVSFEIGAVFPPRRGPWWSWTTGSGAGSLGSRASPDSGRTCPSCGTIRPARSAPRHRRRVRQPWRRARRPGLRCPASGTSRAGDRPRGSRRRNGKSRRERGRER